MKTKYIALLALSALLMAACDKKQKAEEGKGITEQAHEEAEEVVLTEAQMKAVNIQLGKIEQKELNSVIRVNGELSLDPQRRADVTTLVGGVIKKILVMEGRSVTAGQTVAYLENTDIVELQKKYLTTQKELLIAEQDYRRQRELKGQGAGVEKTLQQASANYEITRAELIGLEKQLKQIAINPGQVSAGNMVTQIPIKAPITGIINKVNVNMGSYADMQTPLMSISDISGIHCDIKLFEKDINAVKIGQVVDVSLTNQQGITFKAVVYEINKSFESDTKTISVHAKITGKPGVKLIPGMYVTGLINVGLQKSDAVPNDAVVSSEGKKYIFVLGEKKKEKDGTVNFHFKKIEIFAGISELGYTQITASTPFEGNKTVVKSNAFYLASMTADHGEH